jgi:hypothetical protein
LATVLPAAGLAEAAFFGAAAAGFTAFAGFFGAAAFDGDFFPAMAPLIELVESEIVGSGDLFKTINRSERGGLAPVQHVSKAKIS